jgi:hypothetical protein
MGPLRGQLLENKQDVASAFIADEKTAPNEYCNLSSLTDPICPSGFGIPMDFYHGKRDAYVMLFTLDFLKIYLYNLNKLY